MKKKFALSFSGGKDCTLALYRMLKAGHVPVCLMTTFNLNKDRSWFHSIPKKLLSDISDSLQIPLKLIICREGDDYTKAYDQALIACKNEGADTCVFGDIDLQAHRDWCEERCNNAGLQAVLPLWREDREILVREFIAAGFTAVIKTVRRKELNEQMLGKILTYELVDEIKKLGADPCGENGEYHTVVTAGPIFSYPVNYKITGTEQTETHCFLRIE